MNRNSRGILARSSRGRGWTLAPGVGRGLAGFATAVVCAVACLLVMGVGVAVAVPASFGGEGDESGQFQDPNGIAVEQESGDVYVVDSENRRVDKFGAGGEFLFAWGWGVADGHTEALQRCTTSCFAGIRGAGSGQFSESAGVAVDNDLLSASHGDVYVVDAGNNRVEKFDSEGNFLLTFGGGVNEATNGDVCLAGEACRAGTEGSEHGEFERLREGGGVAVDAAGNVFVGDLNRVQEFSSGGVFAAQVTLPGVGSIGAVAIDSSGDVYVGGLEAGGVRKFEGCAASCTGVELGAPRDASGVFAYSANGFISLGAAGEVFIADGRQGESSHIREFDPSGAELASFDANSEGNQAGIAFADGVGEIYVLDRTRVRVVSPPPPGPLVIAQSASEPQPTTATVAATLNAEGHETTYHFEYGTTTAYGASTTPATLAGSAFDDEPVSTPLSGLQPGTVYHYRVVASNSAGTAFGEDETFATLPPVLIDGESVSGVTSTSATLAALVNPLGRDTKYRLEYGTATSYGSSVPVPDGDVGSGTSDVPVSALVEGLAPSTTYHFRLVAYNSYNAPGSIVEGPDRMFTTQDGRAPVLADARAWEMVSPPQKRGYLLEPIGGNSLGEGAEIQAAADGSAITYAAQGSIDAEPKGNRSVAPSQILSTRTVGGWSSADIATPHEAVAGLEPFTEISEYRVFSPDLSVGLVEPGGDTPLSPQATERTPYERAANGEFMPLVTAANVPPGTRFGRLGIENGHLGTLAEEGDVEFVGATPDLGHVILSSSPPLTEGIAAPANNQLKDLFEWAGGSLRLVSVLPNGKAVTEEGEGTIVDLGYQSTGSRTVRHAVSDDGSRVFWTVSQDALYLRDLGRDAGRGETVRLDAAEPGVQSRNNEHDHPVFATASSDGSKAFFMDWTRLTVDSTVNSKSFESDVDGGELYMCVVGEAAGKLACRLKDLTVDHNAGETADVLGQVLGASEDGRYVYFVANGVLAAGATPGNCNGGGAGEGACNLYVYDTVAGAAKLVARLSTKDYRDWLATGNSGLQQLTAGVSPDGRYLAFMSGRSLTGYDNTDAHGGQPDLEVFLYDAVTGRLVCASCDPSGARPSGVFDSGETPRLLVDHPDLWKGRWLAGSIPGWTGAAGTRVFYRSRYLSNDGRLFFNSPDALVPGDANGKEDVYEYEPPKGEGTAASDSCSVASSAFSSTSGGCVSLVSSGTSGEESAFLDASESGDDVFFLTSAQLAPQDLDSALDVYDAHVCSSSSPCLAGGSAVSPPCATADACRTAPSQQPGVFGAPPSATFNGAGNPVPSASKPVVRKKALTLAQKRAAALRKCRSKPRRKRAACEAQARKAYRANVRAKRSRVGVTTKKGSR